MLFMNKLLDHVRIRLVGNPAWPHSHATDWRFTGSGVIGYRPGEAASAMTGVEVADVMALAQADSRGHRAVSTGPDRKRYRPLRSGEADALSRHHSFQ